MLTCSNKEQTGAVSVHLVAPPTPLLCSPGWPPTHSLEKYDLEHLTPPPHIHILNAWVTNVYQCPGFELAFQSLVLKSIYLLKK